MKWSGKVDEQSKEKIELLYKEFDRFIEENHTANTPEDSLLLKQWSNFRTLIEKDPTDFEVMHTHINHLTDEESKPSRGASPYQASKSSQDNRVDLNRVKLKKMSSDLLNAVAKNNREMFRA